MLIRQVQVEASQMHRELLLRDTELAELGRHDIHAVRRAEGCDRAAVLGQHHWHHQHIRRLQRHGMSNYRGSSYFLISRIFGNCVIDRLRCEGFSLGTLGGSWRDASDTRRK